MVVRFIELGGSAMQLLLKCFLASFLLVLGSTVWANCACFCVDGSPKTLCATVSEAQGEPNECPALSPNSCPSDLETISGGVHDAPEEGATNCRDVRVWDAAHDRFIHDTISSGAMTWLTLPSFRADRGIHSAAQVSGS